MKEHPEVSEGDWIKVGNVDCIVQKLYQPDSPFGVGQVLFNRDKPTTHEVDWDGEKWIFPERGDYGGYARPSDPYVWKLKKGRF